jgi:hypothetical protein
MNWCTWVQNVASVNRPSVALAMPKSITLGFLIVFSENWHSTRKCRRLCQIAPIRMRLRPEDFAAW